MLEEPEEERMVESSSREESPIDGGEGWCGAEGGLFEAMCRAAALPYPARFISISTVVPERGERGRKATYKHHNIQQRIRPQPIRPMHTHTRRLPRRIQPLYHALLTIFTTILPHIQHAPPEIRRHAAHAVMHRRQHGDRLPRHIDARKHHRRLRDPG